MIYCYDGSFAGFLCGVSTALEAGATHPEFVGNGAESEAGLFQEERHVVATDTKLAQAFRERFIAAVSRDAFATARYAFHSREQGIELLVWRYLRLGLEQGRTLEAMLAHEPVHSVNRIARRVSHEAHKFKGFVRFREVAAGFLYASIEPQGDILELISPHFADRIGDRPWMIHDVGRSVATVCNHGSWRLVCGIELAATPALTAEEEAFTRLWQRYFQRMAIPERFNPKLQQQHVPLRVRKHLPEFNVSPSNS